jgi:hypothetical protein
MPFHRDYLLKYGYPPNFIYYFLIDMFSFFTKEVHLLNIATIFILTLALYGKFCLSARIYEFVCVSDEIDNKLINNKYLVSFLLAIVFSLPSVLFIFDGRWYLGQLVPNVWHNSTTILLMPFSCYMVLLTLMLLKKNQTDFKTLIILVFVGIISVFIKPSFAFIYVPSLIVSGLIQRKWSLLLIAMLLVVFIIIQYYLIYIENHVADIYSKDGETDLTTSSVEIDVFRVWKYFSNGSKSIMLVSFVSSLLFPIAFIFSNFKIVIQDQYFRLSLLMATFGLLIFFIFKESGTRQYHGNFYWNAVVGLYFLWSAVVFSFFRYKSLLKKQKLLSYLFNLHVLSGCIYILRILIMGSYV